MMRKAAIIDLLILLLLAAGSVAFSGFQLPRPSIVLSSTGSSSSSLFAKKKKGGKAKGFGTTAPAAAAAATKEEAINKAAASARVERGGSSSSSSEPPVMNAGQRALAEMRRQKAEERDAELRRVREMIRVDEQMKETPAAIPEKVAQRMGARMLPFVGIPLFLGMGTFVGFWYMATYRNMEFEPSLVAASTIAILVFGLLVSKQKVKKLLFYSAVEGTNRFFSRISDPDDKQGITYSLMSASWDPDREGSFLGTEEFAKNVDNVKEGFGRSRENALLRDKMSSMGEDELGSALVDLERREFAEAKKQQSLESKLKEELD